MFKERNLIYFAGENPPASAENQIKEKLNKAIIDSKTEIERISAEAGFEDSLLHKSARILKKRIEEYEKTSIPFGPEKLQKLFEDLEKFKSLKKGELSQELALELAKDVTPAADLPGAPTPTAEVQNEALKQEVLVRIEKLEKILAKIHAEKAKYPDDIVKFAERFTEIINERKAKINESNAAEINAFKELLIGMERRIAHDFSEIRVKDKKAKFTKEKLYQHAEAIIYKECNPPEGSDGLVLSPSIFKKSIEKVVEEIFNGPVKQKFAAIDEKARVAQTLEAADALKEELAAFTFESSLLNDGKFKSLIAKIKAEIAKANEFTKANPDKLIAATNEMKKAVEESRDSNFQDLPEDTQGKKEAAPEEKNPLKKLADLLKKEKNIEVSPDQLNNALLYYDPGLHEQDQNIADHEKSIIDAIFALKKEGKLKGIRINFMGGTDGMRHNKTQSKEWHQAKSIAFDKLIGFKDRTIPRNLLDDSKITLIRAYQKAVGEDTVDAFFQVQENKDAFFPGGALFDLALALQRAEDLKKKYENADLNNETDYLDLQLGANVDDQKQRISGISIAWEQDYVPAETNDDQNVSGEPPVTDDDANVSGEPPAEPEADPNVEPAAPKHEYTYDKKTKILTIERPKLTKYTLTLDIPEGSGVRTEIDKKKYTTKNGQPIAWINLPNGDAVIIWFDEQNQLQTNASEGFEGNFSVTLKDNVLKVEEVKPATDQPPTSGDATPEAGEQAEEEDLSKDYKYSFDGTKLIVTYLKDGKPETISYLLEKPDAAEIIPRFDSKNPQDRFVRINLGDQSAWFEFDFQTGELAKGKIEGAKSLLETHVIERDGGIIRIRKKISAPPTPPPAPPKAPPAKPGPKGELTEPEVLQMGKYELKGDKLIVKFIENAEKREGRIKPYVLEVPPKAKIEIVNDRVKITIDGLTAYLKFKELYKDPEMVYEKGANLFDKYKIQFQHFNEVISVIPKMDAKEEVRYRGRWLANHYGFNTEWNRDNVEMLKYIPRIIDALNRLQSLPWDIRKNITLKFEGEKWGGTGFKKIKDGKAYILLDYTDDVDDMVEEIKEKTNLFKRLFLTTVKNNQVRTFNAKTGEPEFYTLITPIGKEIGWNIKSETQGKHNRAIVRLYIDGFEIGDQLALLEDSIVITSPWTVNKYAIEVNKEGNLEIFQVSTASIIKNLNDQVTWRGKDEEHFAQFVRKKVGNEFKYFEKDKEGKIIRELKP